MVRIRRALTDTLMSFAALAVLLAVLAAVNEDVRNEVSRRLTSGRAVTEVAASTRSVANGIFRTAHSQTIGYASLVFFVCAAGVLVVFMLRV